MRSGRFTPLMGLGVALLVALAYAYGYVSFRYNTFPAGSVARIVAWARSAAFTSQATAPPGRWRPARKAPDDAGGAGFGLPYAAGSRPAGSARGVTIYRPAEAAPGYNLVVSGHAAEAVLLDMEGRRLHAWTGSGEAGTSATRSAPYWRRVRLLESGDILAIREGVSLSRIDATSRTVWTHACECHHDLDVDPDGNILVLDRRPAHRNGLDLDGPALEDWVVVLSPDGDGIDEFSVLEAFQESEFSRLLDAMPGRGDLFHTNSLSLVGQAPLAAPTVGPRFAPDDIVVSLRHLDIVAVIGRADRRVAWAVTGLFRRQHDPVLLPKGTLLLFDNLAGPRRSRVIEVDPASLRIVWSYEGSEEAPFYSETCGTAQRLPNGNTLITESDEGRAFEVTPAGRIVWEFRSPYRAGDDGELVATLFDVVRLPPEFPVASFAAGNKGR